MTSLLRHLIATIALTAAVAVTWIPDLVSAEDEGCRTAPSHNLLKAPSVLDTQLEPVHADYLLLENEVWRAGKANAIPFTSTPCLITYPAPKTNESLWLRFTIENRGDTERHIWLTFVESYIGRAELYTSWPPGPQLAAVNGLSVPERLRADTSLQVLVPFKIASASTETYYLRVSEMIAPTVRPIVLAPASARKITLFTTIVSALFSGFLFAILCISLILFRHVDISDYQYYAYYIAAILLGTIIWDGWLSHLVGTVETTGTLFRIYQFIVTVAAGSYVLFARTILYRSGGNDQPGRVFYLLAGLLAALGLISMIDPWTLSIPLDIAFFVSAFVLVFIAIRRARKGLPEAAPMSVALSFLAVGLLAAEVLYFFPLAPSGKHLIGDILLLRAGDLLFNTAIMGEIVFMFVAVSVRARLIQSERERSVEEANALRTEATTIRTAYSEDIERSLNKIEALQSTLIADPKRALLSPADKRFVAWAQEQILANIADPDFGVRELALALGTSEKTLGRKLKQALGQTTIFFIRAQRLARARELILTRQFNSVAEVGYAVGISSSSHFTKLYRQEYGETPSSALRQAIARRTDDDNKVE